jgi:uncharacterized membrane protein
MNQHIPTWINLIFVLVTLVGVCSLGLVLGTFVEIVSPQAPEVALGPLLCPAGTSLEIRYARGLGGGVRETLLNCVDAAGHVVSTRSGYLSSLWYGLFMLPLLPLIYPIVLGLRRHNFSVRGQAGAGDGRASARLRELEGLRASGLISEEEYRRKRREILAEL